MSEAPPLFNPGDPFRGYPYTIIKLLARGRSGDVYVVEHRFTGDRFALKVGHLQDQKSAKKVARSLVEAQATYRLRHQNVVHVFDLACEDDGMVWQRMELLEGSTVGDLLAGGSRLSPLYAIDVAVEVAWALQAAHEQQIIHRDIHPWNVFVTSAGVVKILDFSLAKVASAPIQTTRSDGVMGTDGYMAPEQLRNGPATTPRVDVYALGILLWQMITGRHPFEDRRGNMMQLVEAQLLRDPESLVTAAGLPAYCDEVIRRATARDPAQRYESAWALAQALRDLRERLAADRTAAPLLRDRPSWERRHPIVGRAPEGHHDYLPPKSLPRELPAPHVPSARIVVPPAPPQETRRVAATIPMAAFIPSVPPPSEIAAPTVRGGPPARPRRLWIALVAAPVLIAVTAAAGAWLLASTSEPVHPRHLPRASR